MTSGKPRHSFLTQVRGQGGGGDRGRVGLSDFEWQPSEIRCCRKIGDAIYFKYMETHIMSKEQEAAIQEWIDAIRPPSVAIDAIRRKFRRLNLSPEEIRTDKDAKLSRLTK